MKRDERSLFNSNNFWKLYLRQHHIALKVEGCTREDSPNKKAPDTAGAKINLKQKVSNK